MESGDHATLNVRRGADFLLRAGAGTGAPLVGTYVPASTGMVSRVVDQRASVIVADYQLLPDAPEIIKGIGLRSMIAVPILIHGEIAAVLVVGRRALRPFDEEERGML